MEGDMRDKTIISILFFMLIMLLLSGCWNRREPNVLAIVESSVNDLTEDNQHSLTLEIFDPTIDAGDAESGGSGTGKTIIINSVAESSFEAVRNATKSIDRKLYIGHVRARFYSEKLVKKGIHSLLEFYLRDHEARQDPVMAVVKGENPEKLYSCSRFMADSMGSYIVSTAQSQNKAISQSVYTTTIDFIKDYYEEGIEPVMGVIEIIADPAVEKSEETEVSTKYIVSYNGLAVFKGAQMVGYLDGIETRSYNLLVGDFGSAVVRVPEVVGSPGEEYSELEVINAKPEISVSFANEKVTVDASIKMKIVIAKQDGTMDTTQKDILLGLEQDFNEIIEGQVMSAVQKVQGLKSDIFGFGKAMHCQHPEIWREISADWDRYFSEADVHIDVQAKIIETGNIKKYFSIEK